MKSLRCLLLLVPGFLCAEPHPHVPGYARFHAENPSAEGGAILYSELGCANCHGNSPAVVPRMGPALNGISKRVQRDWVQKHLETPGSSTMPAVFDALPEPERAAAVDDVIAWLGSLQPDLKIPGERHMNAERGSALYHEIGCAACHGGTGDVPQAETTWPSVVSLSGLPEKTTHAPLTYFLKNAEAIRPDGRMPHLSLEPKEAADIAAHLLDLQFSDGREAPQLPGWPKESADRIQRGLEMAEQLNCAACHSVPNLEAAELVPLSGWAPVPEAHGYNLSENQTESLRLFLDSNAEPSVHVSLAAMNCYACHARDEVGAPVPESDLFFVGDEALGDSGRFPPPLTGIGHKLLPDALAGVFRGEEEFKLRTYVKTRMPVYKTHAATLAEWLQEVDAEPDAVKLAEVDDLEAGRKLLGVHGGVNCITCHQWEGRNALGIQAMDLSSLNSRIRPEWFRSYLLNPAEYRPGTLMPPLWPGGKSTITDVLEGSTELQIAAIWNFMAEGDGIPEGFPNHVAGEFELIPEDRPIIQRTFLEGVGTRTVLVGFPAGIHLAYNPDTAQPALSWKGRFFDAYETWFLRKIDFQKPLEDQVVVWSGNSNDGRFLGYELDEQGNPTFLSRSDSGEIRDHFRVEETRLIRTVTWESGAPEFAHPKNVARQETLESNRAEFIYIWK